MSLLVLLLGAWAIHAIVGALIVQLATEVVAKFKPHFGIAIATVAIADVIYIVLVYAMSAVLGGLLWRSMGFLGSFMMPASYLITAAIGVLISAAVISALIKSEHGERLRYPRACLVAAAVYAASLAMGALLPLLAMLMR